MKNIATYTLFTLLSLSLLGFFDTVLGGGNEHHEEEKKGFDASELIMHHIGDAHDWHVMDIGGHPVSIPLPIIIYDTERGLSVFLSSKFNHGHDAYNGYLLNHGHIVAVDSNGDIDETATANIYDLSITKNVAAVFVSIAILLLVFISVAKSYTRRGLQAPKGLQSLIEPLILFVRDDIAKSAIGHGKHHKFMPFLLTIFFFIFINNLMGLIPIPPFGANVTGNIAVPLVLAVFTFVMVTINGNGHYWKHIFAMPGVPIPVLIILTPIEILGVFLKPFVLMIRLFANITAGHIIVLAFFSLIFIFGDVSAGAGLGASLFTLIFTVFMSCLELLVAFIQAYVFTLLSAVYLGMAVEEAHH